jgi:dolichol-phosphate mannosyltransferase
MNMLMTGIMGLYIGRIHAEVKRRPLYVVSQTLGFERESKQVRGLLSASAD